MNIKRAKQEIKNTIQVYLTKNAHGEYEIPSMRQRPVLLIGPPGIGKTQIMEQIAQEGAIQIFKTPYTGMEEVIVGVVGTLQFDVLEYRLRSEYNVELYKEGLPYEYLRWIVRDDPDAPPLKEEDLLLPNDAKLVEDYKGNQLLLFAAQWSIQWVQDKNKDLKLAEFGGAKF